MDSRVLGTLAYDKIIQRLQQHAVSATAQEVALQLQPFTDFQRAVEALRETDQARLVMRLKGLPPLNGIKDIRPVLKRARIGAVLGPEQLLAAADTLRAGRGVKAFIQSVEAGDEPLERLRELADGIEGLKPLEDQIRQAIGDQAEVLDQASPDLRQIRQTIRNLEARIRSRLEQMIRHAGNQKKLQEAFITIRRDRFVIPVKQAYRDDFGGMIHDQSASGATLFIEPEAVVQMNNERKQWVIKEEREIERILRQLTLAVGQYADALEANVERLTCLDFIFAKGLLSEEMAAASPVINQERRLVLKEARHPLIAKEDVVPLNLTLGEDFQSIIITGPNTGGKTVTLKTVGLLTLMAMSGLHIPAEAGSRIPFVSGVYADIGDEQSIEQSLSTFSSHMTHIIRIMRQMDENSLVLLDELGAGTDPTEGAALAIAILDEVLQKGALVMATTHYSELKAYAYNREGVINASVEFDMETLRPTYRLLVGVPGRSNAFAIAERLGLPESVIRRAKAQVADEAKRVENMIADLEQKRKTAEARAEHTETMRQEIARLKAEWESRNQAFERERDKMLAEAERQAKAVIERARREAETVIAQLRQMAEQQAAPIKEHQLIEARKRLSDALEIEEAGPRASVRTRRPPVRRLQPGDPVKVLSLNQKGHIIEKSGDDYLVQVGIMKVKIRPDDLQPAEQEHLANQQKTVARITRSEIRARTDLDLRGRNLEEALLETDRFIDEALLNNLGQVTIIHGKGTGILRQGIHDYLRQHRYVKAFRLGQHNEGGSGATVVQLK